MMSTADAPHYLAGETETKHREGRVLCAGGGVGGPGGGESYFKA